MSASPKILIVDDSEDNVVYISQILEHNGYAYDVARDGVEAIEKLDADPPALVLLDIMMPRKSGAAVLKRMREDPKLQGIPAIIVSGAPMVTGVDLETGDLRPLTTYKDELTRGVGVLLRDILESLKPDAVVEKPVNPTMLVEKIRELLK